MKLMKCQDIFFEKKKKKKKKNTYFNISAAAGKSHEISRLIFFEK